MVPAPTMAMVVVLVAIVGWQPAVRYSHSWEMSPRVEFGLCTPLLEPPLSPHVPKSQRWCTRPHARSNFRTLRVVLENAGEHVRMERLGNLRQLCCRSATTVHRCVGIVRGWQSVAHQGCYCSNGSPIGAPIRALRISPHLLVAYDTQMSLAQRSCRPLFINGRCFASLPHPSIQSCPIVAAGGTTRRRPVKNPPLRNLGEAGSDFTRPVLSCQGEH